MSDNNNNQDVQVETTSVFRADLLKEMESGAAAPATGSDITPPSRRRHFDREAGAERRR